MLRNRQVQEPHEGCFGRHALRCVVGWSGARADRYSEAPTDSVSNHQDPRSVREEAWRSPGSRLSSQTLERQTPWEAPAVAGLKLRVVARHSREAWTQEPGPVRPVWRLRAAEILPGTTVCGFASGRKAGKTSREGKPPKGESHERCRCETKPARDSREQAVKRVAKP
jgi:hypothetical protein